MNTCCRKKSVAKLTRAIDEQRSSSVGRAFLQPWPAEQARRQSMTVKVRPCGPAFRLLLLLAMACRFSSVSGIGIAGYRISNQTQWETLNDRAWGGGRHGGEGGGGGGEGGGGVEVRIVVFGTT